MAKSDFLEVKNSITQITVAFSRKVSQITVAFSRTVSKSAIKVGILDTEVRIFCRFLCVRFQVQVTKMWTSYIFKNIYLVLF